MAEILEIPELNNANLMELTVCGRLRTRNARIKEKLRKLKDGIFARVGSKKSNQYIDVFGSTLETNHLHVDVMIRPTKWARGKEFHALDNVISADDGAHERGVQKVAIFVNDGVPVHVAMQPSSRNGIWKSKMAYNIDMEHELNVIETLDGDDPALHGYGKAVKFMYLANGRRS